MQVAVLIPCFNEASTIAKVVDDFTAQLPDAAIYVYDNNSSDDTASIAAQHGAIVRRERRQGKGFVVRSMFRDIDADVYVLVDGDDTYPADAVHDLIEAVQTGQADMAVGDRLSGGVYARQNKRAFHGFGNRLVRWSINAVFHSSFADVMSGYRAFSRRFVKNMPVSSPGFEIETEMTLHALDRRCLITEIPVAYRDRPAGSVSKLNTCADGFRVLATILRILKDYRPLAFFGGASLLFFALGLAVGIPVVIEYAETGLVPRFPSAILAAGLELMAAISLVCGLILDTITRHFKEVYELLAARREDQGPGPS